MHSPDSFGYGNRYPSSGDASQQRPGQTGYYSNPNDSYSSRNPPLNYSGPNYGDGSQGPIGSYDQPADNYGKSPYTIPEAIRQGYKFSQEEQKIMKECSNEAFYKRCLPLMGLMGTAAYFASKAGYLKIHPTMGSLPKVFIATAAGWFVGKMSYLKTCEEKFLTQLPHSNVSANIRRRHFGEASSSLPLPPAQPSYYPPPSNYPPFREPVGVSQPYPEPYTSSPLGGTREPSITYSTSELAPRHDTDDYVGNVDVDSDKNKFDLTDDHSGDHSLDVEAPPNWKTEQPAGSEVVKPSVNYDDVRRQHRDEFYRKTPQRQQPQGPRQYTGY